MSRRDVCREVLGLDPEKLREIAPRLIAIYIAKLASRGDVKKAMAVAYEAYMKGYRSDYLDRLYEQIAALYGLNKLINKSIKAVSTLSLGEQGTAEKIRAWRSKILEYIDNNPVPEATKEYAKQVAEALDKIAEVSDYLHAVNQKAGEAVGIINDVADQIKNAHGIDELYTAFSRFAEVQNAISMINKALNITPPDTTGLPRAYSDVIEKTREQLYRARGFAEALYSLTSHGIHIMAALATLLNNLQKYGEGDNLLSNSTYRYALKSSITHILTHVNKMQDELSHLGARYARYGVGQVITKSLDSANAIVDIMNNLKQQLGKGDPRFVDIFEEAESESGLNLISVEKPMEAIPGLENFVRNIADTTRQYFRTGDTLTKILAAIGIIGAGALDALSIILRPGAAMEQIKALQEMLTNTQKAINEKGLAGLGEAASKLFNDMFGTTENALYTTGGILAMIALSKAVGKLPVPEKLRAVLVDALQADPIGLVLSSAEALGVTNLLKQVLLRPRGGRLIRYTIPRGLTTAVQKTLEKSLRRAFGAEAAAVAERLTKKLAELVRKGVKIEELRKALTEAVQKHGLEKLVQDYRRMIDVHANLEAAGQRMLATAKNIAIDNTMAKPYGYGIIDTIKRYIKGKHGMLDNAADTIKKYMKGEIGLDTFKAELGSILEKLGLTDLVKKLENIETTKDAAKFIDHIKQLLDIDEIQLEKSIKTMDIDALLEISHMIRDTIANLRKLVTANIDDIERALTDNTLRGRIRNAITKLRGYLSRHADNIEKPLARRLLDELDELEKAYNETLGMLDNAADTIKKYMKGEIGLDTFKAELGSILEKLGLTDLVKKLENIETTKDAARLLPEINTALASRLALVPEKLISNLTQLFGTFMKTKPGKILRALHGRIIERTYLRIAESYASPALGEAFLDTVKRFGLEAPEELMDLAKKGLLTIEDIEKYIDNLAKTTPKAAGTLEAFTVKKFIETMLKRLKETDPTAASILRKIGGRFISEVKVAGAPGVYTAVRMLALDTAPTHLIHTLKTLKHYLDELNPEYARKLEHVINKFAEETASGKVTEKTLKELFKTVRKVPSVKGVKPSILAKLRYALMDYLDWLEIKNKYKPEATRVLKKMADVIATDLEALEKELLKKGKWGFLDIALGEVKVTTPLIGDAMTLKEFYRLIGEPIQENVIKIGDKITIIGRRIAKLLPDGTLRIEYTLELPGKGKILKIAKTTRPLTTLRQKLGQVIHGPHSKADLLTKHYELRAGTVYEVFYDPEALTLLKRSPEFAEQLFSGDVFRKIDPAFDVLDKVFVANIPTMTVGQLLLNTLRLAPWLAAAGLAMPAATMPQLLDYLSKLPRTEARELAKQGWIVLSGYKLPSGEKIVVALPSSIDLVRRIREYANLKTPYGTIRVPVVKLNEKQYYVITPIQVELPKLQYQQIEIPKQKTTPSPTPTPTTTGLPTGVGIPFGVPWLGLKTKKGKTTSKRQREKLMI